MKKSFSDLFTFLFLGAVVAIISDENSLTAFGYILGPALAAGYNIILQTGPQLVLLASLLIEIAAQVGLVNSIFIISNRH